MSSRKKSEHPDKHASPGSVEYTPDGRYIIVDGRRWRATDPSIPEEERKRLVAELMRARRDVARAKRENDQLLERDARDRVDAAKRALGERGPAWWTKNEKNESNNEENKENDDS